MTAFEMAEKYYPELWSSERLKMLVEANKLTPDEYFEITGEEYE